MKTKKSVLLLLCLLLTLSLTSCYDSKELDEWAYVYTLGIDKGKTSNFSMTVQLPTFKQGESGGDGGGNEQGKSKDFAVITVDCPSLYTGLNEINTSLSRTINLTHCQYILISEEMAKKDIGYVCDAIVRDRQVRRISHLLIVKGQAKDFINSFNPVVGTAISKTQEGQMQQINMTGLAGGSTLGEFLNALKSTTAQSYTALASLNSFSGQTGSSSGGSSNKMTFSDYLSGELPREGGNSTEYLGTAIFNGGKMVDELNSGESQVMMMMRGDFQRASLALKDPIEKELTDTIKLQMLRKPLVTVDAAKEKPSIRLELFMEGDLQQVQSLINKKDSHLIPLLEKEFTGELENRIYQTFEKCRNRGSDIFGFGGTAVRQFGTIQEWEKYGWLAKFKKATLKVKVNFVIHRDGTLLKNSPIIKGESSDSNK